MKKVKIGCLMPVSGVMPSMAKDFKNGLNLGLEQVKATNVDVEVIPEHINQGQIQNVSEAINKLANYHDVDVLTGIVSQLVLKELLNVIDTRRIPFICSNLGEYVPSKEISSPVLFQNSLNLWQSQWAMGKWAQQQYGGTPAICFSVYDAGYHLHEAFRVGARAEGSATAHINMLPLVPNHIDASPLIKLIEDQRPSHVHAILCGVDGKDFLKCYSEAGLLGKVPLTVCPFLVEDNLTSGIERLVGEIPNSITWSYDLKSSENTSFINIYENTYMKKPSVFSVLGYESGLAIIHALNATEAEDISIEDALSEVSFVSPRGVMTLNANNYGPVYIRKPHIGDGGLPVNQVIGELPSVDQQDPDIALIAENGVSGWQNPYLCI